MNKYCVIGEKLPHTLSPQIHKLFFEHRGEQGEYGVREFSKSEILNAKGKLSDLDGFNVTIPYKHTVISMLDVISDEAKAIGAVNTVKNIDGKLYGYNTDPYGFSALLSVNGIDPCGKSAVVLGSGGAAKSVLYALSKLGVSSLIYVKRDEDEFIEGYEHITYASLKGVKGYLLVNTTPVGMYPHVGVSPVSDEIIDGFQAVADVVYNPAMTEFARKALRLGKKACSGLYMLVAQAIRSQSIWRDEAVCSEDILPIFNAVQRDFFIDGNNNIYLIGMMSCGKTTLGQELSRLSGRQFIDADKYIEEREGKSIPQMFAEGEEVFRVAERRAMLDIAEMKGAVVATGGGAVLSQINRDAMRMSGIVIYVDRSVEKIVSHVDCTGRPLLSGGAEKLYQIYDSRKNLYKSCAHFTIKNNDGLEQGLDAIREVLDEDKSN